MFVPEIQTTDCLAINNNARSIRNFFTVNVCKKDQTGLTLPHESSEKGHSFLWAKAGPQSFKLFLESSDQHLLSGEDEVFFIVFGRAASPVVAAIQQQC